MWVVTRSSIWNFWARSSLLRCHFQGKSVPVSRIFLFQASHHCWGVSPRNDVWQVCGTSAEIFPDTYEQLRSSSGGMGRDPFNQTFPEFSVQNSMDRFGPSGKVSKKRVHLLRWSSFPGRTGWNFGWMDRAHGFRASTKAILYRVSTISLVIPRILIVYSISCRRCPLLYTGETGRNLRSRFSEHLRRISNNTPGCPLAQHFNSTGHSISDVQVRGMVWHYAVVLTFNESNVRCGWLFN